MATRSSKPIQTNVFSPKGLTDRAVTFIEKNKDKPFFLYVPHIMPHVPIFASDSFRGKSARGLYGDVIEEIDWSVGEIVKTIDRLNLSENTLVIFTNDNGPFLSYGTHAGQSGALRGGKLTTFEGGVRVPMVARWPGQIPARTYLQHSDYFNRLASNILPSSTRSTA
jgi:arylsulfatase